MFLIDALLVLAMLFFVLLPMTDRRTVHMRLCTFFVLVAAVAVSIAHTPLAPVQLAGIVLTH
ncbi:hypothetical protein [Bradyrhizobium iriomotense]|uniref:hypothetical protein n=1 Tax=Bradyrhizobium iriomotense TaxID=441950 RepID=UPI001B8A38DB|nr:hypothetical protein [Bradyrhizobium iriomotense]MBR1133553.1 hypothetical protein [Bradyrhizobium iriomotense]